jgi:hypothetical protein
VSPDQVFNKKSKEPTGPLTTAYRYRKDATLKPSFNKVIELPVPLPDVPGEGTRL